LSSSIPLPLHSGQQTLDAPEQSGIRSAHGFIPARQTSSPSHPMVSGVRSAHSPSRQCIRATALHSSVKKTTQPTNRPACQPSTGTAARARPIPGRLPFLFGRRFALPSIEAAPDLT